MKLAGDPLAQMEQLEARILAGDNVALNNWLGIVKKLAEKALNGNIRAAKAVSDIVDKHRPAQQSQIPGRTPVSIAMAMTWLPSR